MKKTHLHYLRRLTTIMLDEECGDSRERVNRIGDIKGSNTPVYQMMRDIVCDARFYSVGEKSKFWNDYATVMTCEFIDSLSEEDWGREDARTEKKEEFLNTWMADHIIPLSAAEREEIEQRLIRMPTGGGLMFEDTADGEAEVTTPQYSYGFGVREKTDDEDPPSDDLPEEAKRLLDGFNGVMSGLPGMVSQLEEAYLSSIDPALIELARKIGRCGGEPDMVKGKFSHAAKSDISGIMTGNDLNRMLPTETALLADTKTDLIFYHRFASHGLQLFSSASSSVRPEKKEHGPIYICVDTSSSMTGEPEMTAKRLAICIAMVADRGQRPVFMINYSHTLSFFVLTDFRRQCRSFLSFLSRSYAGGNDEEKLFKFLFRSLPESPRYSRWSRLMDGADLLIISDFQWDKLRDKTVDMIDAAHGRGMLFYGLGVNISNSRNPFFMSCDGRYTYSGGRLKEL